MGSDVQGSLTAAEKLLKQGRIDDALAEFDRLVDDARGDLLTVNRVGDILASGGHPDKAVLYYGRIADQFARQGFFPKAIAIRKKILRLTPESAGALVNLGDLYVRQEHPAEARHIYLRAADLLLQKKDFDGAREVYERLVAAEPDDPRHRVRLAETRAAAGDAPAAAGDLIELGQRLLHSGKPEDAERAFRRAAELDASRPEIVQGLIGCLTETGRDDEALELLEAEAQKPGAALELTAELLVLYEANDRSADTDTLLLGESAPRFSNSAFKNLVQFHAHKGTVPALWARLTPMIQAWAAGEHRARAIELLDGVPGWTAPAHLAAMKWRLRLAQESEEAPSHLIVLMERLVSAYEAQEMEAEAAQLRSHLEELRPNEAEPVAAIESPGESVPVTSEHATAADVAVEYEAPAVPLSRADEEFVAGRLTQAEILEKYGLVSQATDQLYEVIDRFPGHLDANQRLVTLLRGMSQRTALAKALVKLALARRAAGRLDAARQAIQEGEKLGGVDAAVRGALIALDLLPGEHSAASPEVIAAPAVEAPTATPPAATPPAASPRAEPPPPSASPVHGSKRETVIDFDSFDDDACDAQDEVVEAPAPAPPPPAAVVPKLHEDPMRFEPLPSLSGDQDDDDLSAIAAALDDELFDDDVLELGPASESEESLDEVFAAFRERVEAEVGADDFRTHYDLGIGYKEMGLVEAAMEQFETSAKCDELHRVSCVMLALCHNDQGHWGQAASWYRRALETRDGDAAEAVEIRYDLAETLIRAGELEQALGTFRDIEAADPSFRDVSQRIAHLTASPIE